MKITDKNGEIIFLIEEDGAVLINGEITQA
jgi:hypothetical protein